MNRTKAISRTKSALKGSFPVLAEVYSKLHMVFIRRQFRRMSLESVFRWHFEQRSWGDGETLSGPGSTLLATRTLRTALSELIGEYGIRSLLDIPCGDGNWISQADLGSKLDLYIGADIVQELVDLNAGRWNARPNCKFLKLDVTRDALPRVDLIFCRDGLVHLSNALAAQALRNIKLSGSRYLLATTFFEHPDNTDIVNGEWRPTNLERPPFNLPSPMKLIVERKTPAYGDKCLGLWEIRAVSS